MVPTTVLSSPDGSCLLAVDRGTVRAYHWASFGSNPGIVLNDLADFATGIAIVTSFVKRSSVHCVWLDLPRQSIRSFAMGITHRITAFSFKEDGSRPSEARTKARTSCNCLIDCHADVWTRFPVVPAVSRQTLKSSSARQPKSLVYVSSLDQKLFQRHHADLISSFEKTTRKPVDDVLSSVIVSGTLFDRLIADPPKVSSFKTGEWLVEMLCLIPIHIALARDNRFIPLKDGVNSQDTERALLGATVDQIVDILSFGWYESIFQSYMASKVMYTFIYIYGVELPLTVTRRYMQPVKVVSSMGMF